MPSKGQKAAAAAKGGGSAAGGGSKPASPTRAKMPKKQADMLDWAQKKLDKPRDDVNHHIGVPYDHWDYSNDAAGRQAEADARKIGTYKCLVVEFELMHKFPAVGYEDGGA